MTRILAIDAATRCGWAATCGTGMECGAQDFSLRRGESAGMRWVRFRAWVLEMIGTVEPEVLVFEQAFIGGMRSGTAAEIAYGMTTRLQEYAQAAGVEYLPVHNATLKRWATGRGNADKAAMVRAAQERFPQAVFEDDNAADAALLWGYAQAGFPEQASAKRPRKAQAAGEHRPEK